MERYARKIDRLPILNVDDDLLAFGADVAERFRKIALARKASGVRMGIRKSRTYGHYYYGRRPTSNRIQIKTEERAKASAVRIKEWKAIEDGLANIRRKMTKRYNVEF